MSLAVVFSGQGAQIPNLGRELCRMSCAAREIYNEASDVLGYDVLRAGDDTHGELSRSVIVQPLLVTYGIAGWAAATAVGQTASVMAGHSLGEISALAAAGALTTRQAIELAAKRGEFMEDSPAGGMLLVFGPSLDTVRGLLGSMVTETDSSAEVWVANHNLPDQSVLSGTTVGLEAAAVALTTAGAIVKPVAIAVPAHSPLMRSAAERLRAVVTRMEVLAPQVPVLSMSTGEEMAGSDDVRVNVVEALTGIVDWPKVVERMKRYDVTSVLECGPRTVLRDISRVLWPEVQSLSTADAAGLQMLRGANAASITGTDFVLRSLRLIVGTPRIDQSAESRTRTEKAFFQLRQLLDRLRGGSEKDTDDSEIEVLLVEALTSKGLDDELVARIVARTWVRG